MGICRLIYPNIRSAAIFKKNFEYLQPIWIECYWRGVFDIEEKLRVILGQLKKKKNVCLG